MISLSMNYNTLMDWPASGPSWTVTVDEETWWKSSIPRCTFWAVRNKSDISSGSRSFNRKARRIGITKTSEKDFKKEKEVWTELSIVTPLIYLERSKYTSLEYSLSSIIVEWEIVVCSLFEKKNCYISLINANQISVSLVF